MDSQDSRRLRSPQEFRVGAAYRILAEGVLYTLARSHFSLSELVSCFSWSPPQWNETLRTGNNPYWYPSAERQSFRFHAYSDCKGCCQRSCWRPRPVLPLETMLRFMAQAYARGQVDVCGPCCRQIPNASPWCMLLLSGKDKETPAVIWKTAD